MNARSISDLTLRSLFAGIAIVWIAGSASQADFDGAALDAAKKERQLRDRSPKTKVWLHNRTGEAIHEIGMRCKSVEPADKSRSYGTSWTRKTTIKGEPQEIWSEKYPDPLVLVTLEVQFEKGARSEYPLNHICQPGDEVVLVIEKGGRVSVKVKK